MSAEPADADQRRLARDADRSVILQAPAGSGKTSLLVDRYLNLLTRVERPEEILAITFTIKAAAEMRARIVATLAGDGAIADTIRAIDQRRGWDLNNRPDRLKIQTIDSFAMALVRRLPVAGAFAFERLTENPAALYEEAAERLLARMADAGDPHADTVADFVALLDNNADQARTIVAGALAKRDQWVGAVRDTAGATERVIASIIDGIKNLRATVTRPLGDAVDDALRKRLEALGRRLASALKKPWAGLDDAAGWQLLAASLLTQAGKPRKSFGAKQGFEPGASVEKSAAKEIAQTLAETGLDERLAKVRDLPEPKVDDAAALGVIATTLSLAVVNLNETFAAHRAADFTQLTLAANRALQDTDDLPTELALALDYRIRHILVDEFQDTSLGQYRMLEALLQGWGPTDGNTFFAVGDPMQSIYRFRDADLRLFLETAKQGFDHLPLEGLRLTSNFRSAEALVNWCNDAFQKLFGHVTDPIHGAVEFASASVENDGPGEVRTILSRDGPEARGRVQGVIVADRIGEIGASASIAILVRSRTVLAEILPELRERGITWRGTDIEPLVDEAVVRDLQSLTTVLFSGPSAPLDTTDRVAWLALLRSPLVGLNLKDLERAAESARAIDPATLSTAGAPRARRLLEALNADRRSLPPRARVERVWLALGGADAYAAKSSIANAERFFELLDRRPDAARHPARLGEELARLYAADIQEQADVEVMTIHRAKGLEFDHVIVPGLERGEGPSSNPLLLWRPEGGDLLLAPRTSRGPRSLYDWLLGEERVKDANERRRLFYVAATRAARSLTLIGTVAENAETAPRGSLLELIWDHLMAATREADQEPAGDLPLELVWNQTTPQARRLSVAVGDHRPAIQQRSRLPVDYRWSPPVELPPIAPRADPAVEEGPVGDSGERREIALGELLHRELKWLAERGGDADYDLGQRALVWARWIAATALPAADATWIQARLNRQVRNLLDDQDGRWVLFQDPDGQCEAPFTAYVDGELTRVVVDRTFVDDGVRWIIDYKSSILATPSAPVIDELRHRYTPQLVRYAEVFATIDKGRPLRTALYLTSIPRLVEVDFAAATVKTGA